MHITNWTVELPAKSVKNSVKVLGAILSIVNQRQLKGNLEINAEVHCSLERVLLNENKNNSGWTHLQHTRYAYALGFERGTEERGLGRKWKGTLFPRRFSFPSPPLFCAYPAG